MKKNISGDSGLCRMKKIAFNVLFLLLATTAVVLADTAVIQTTRDDASTRGRGTVMSATAINSAAYTGWISASGVSSIVLDIDYTNSNGTAVTMTCQTSRASSTTNGSGRDLHVLDISSGTATSTVLTWSNAVSGDESWTWTIAEVPAPFINCAFTAAGGDANDVVTVYARGISP